MRLRIFHRRKSGGTEVRGATFSEIREKNQFRHYLAPEDDRGVFPKILKTRSENLKRDPKPFMVFLMRFWHPFHHETLYREFSPFFGKKKKTKKIPISGFLKTPGTGCFPPENLKNTRCRGQKKGGFSRIPKFPGFFAPGPRFGQFPDPKKTRVWEQQSQFYGAESMISDLEFFFRQLCREFSPFLQKSV